MVYKEKLVAAIKCNNKVLREIGDDVHIPFGSEYTIYLKNMHDRDVVLNIDIDGTDATENGLLLRAGQEVDLERFVGDNLNSGNKFKFIERTTDIEQHRGIGSGDGLIRITYQFARKIDWTYTNTTISSDRWNIPIIGSCYGSAGRNDAPKTFCSQQSAGGYVGGGGTSNAAGAPTPDSIQCNYTANITGAGVLRSRSAEVYDGDAVMDWIEQDSVQNDVGITVKGDESNQSFQTVMSPLLEGAEYAIVFRLLGMVEQTKVKKPITVKTKKICPSCGRKYNSGQKFCQSDGTFLELV